MIVNAMRITLSPEKRTKFFQAVGHYLEQVKRPKGCREFHLYVDTRNENSSLMMSEWDTVSDLNRYLGSQDFAILRGVITVFSRGSVDSKALVMSSRSRELLAEHYRQIDGQERNKTGVINR